MHSGIILVHDVINHVKFRAELEVQKQVSQFAFGYPKRDFVAFFAFINHTMQQSACVELLQIPNVKYWFASCDKTPDHFSAFRERLGTSQIVDGTLLVNTSCYPGTLCAIYCGSSAPSPPPSF